jgi:ABC-type sugar transport system permease subunit
MRHHPSPVTDRELRRRIPRLLALLLLACLLIPAAASAEPLRQTGGSWELPVGTIVHSSAVSADGARTAVGSRDGIVYYLDEKGRELWRYDTGGTVLGLGMTDDGQRIIAATEGRKAILLDGSGQPVWEKEYDFVLYDAAISGDGTLIALVPRSKEGWVLDGEGTQLWTAPFYVFPTAAAISSDGQRVAFGTRDAWIHLFDRSGNLVSKLQLDGVIRGLALSQDGTYAAVGDESSKGYLLKGEPAGANNTVQWTYEAGDKVDGAAISGDGQTVAVGSRDKNAYLLDGAGTLKSKFETGGQVYTVALSADGSTLVIGSDDGKAYGYNVGASSAGYAAGQQRMRLLAVVGTVLALGAVASFVVLLRYTGAGQRAWDKQGAGPRRLARELWRARISYLLLLPTLLLLLTFNYYPAFSGLFHAFTKWNPGLPTRWVGLANFEAILHNQFLRRGMVNALILIVTGYLKVLTMPLLVAELLFHLRSSRLQYWLRSLYIFPIVVPGVAIILIWRNIFDPNIGLINNALAAFGLMNMQTPQAWLGDPQTAIWSIVFIGFPWVGAFALLLYYGGLISIPVELFDAAKVDGASGLRRFWSLDLPLLMGQIRLLLILGFIGGMQEFAVVFLTTEGGPYNATYTPALELYYQAMRFNNFGLASAIGTVLFIVILGGTILNMRYVRSATEFEA